MHAGSAVNSNQSGQSVESVLRHPFVQALSEPIRKPRPQPMYVIMLVLVSALMLVLPGVYLAMIGAVGYAVWWHAVNDLSLFSTVGNAKAALIAYLLPLLTGILLLLFMIKPLFAPRRMNFSSQAVNRHDEPLLFAFVDRLCDCVGAPRPSAIHIDMDLNASAGFKGLLAGVLGGRLILTIGLPLVAGMTLNQFAGVLAHEFGHFAQRSAMRLSYLIRNINGWFARVVYERDGWDEALANASAHGDHWAIQLVAAIARLMVWVSRRVLWVLMMIGHLFSSLLLRQMEYDADRYTARAVGPKRAQEMLAALPVLDVAMQATYSQLHNVWTEKRLPDSLPALVANRIREIPADVRTKLTQAMQNEKTGWFDSHPASCDRVRALARETDEGRFNVDAPAGQLFTNFSVLSRIMTQQFYHENLGPQAQHAELVRVDAIEQQRQTQQTQAKSLTTYFGDLLNPVRGVYLPDLPVNGDEDAIAEELMSLRNAFADAVLTARAAAKEWSEADQKLAAIDQLSSAASAGVKKIDYRKLGLVSDEESVVRQKRIQLQSICASARKRVDAALVPAMRRLQLALELDPRNAPVLMEVTEETYDLADAPPEPPIEGKRSALRAMYAVADLAEAQRRLFHRQQVLLSHIEQYGNQPNFVGAVVALSRKLHSGLEELRSSMLLIDYPYESGAQSMTLAQYFFDRPTTADDVAATFRVTDEGLDKFYALYMRLMADLADQAEKAEAEIGLLPLELPAAD